jgi:hypothetical protein
MKSVYAILMVSLSVALVAMQPSGAAGRQRSSGGNSKGVLRVSPGPAESLSAQARVSWDDHLIGIVRDPRRDDAIEVMISHPVRRYLESQRRATDHSSGMMIRDRRAS